MNALMSMLWWLRGCLCPWLGHAPIDTAPEWVATLGARICRSCYTQLDD